MEGDLILLSKNKKQMQTVKWSKLVEFKKRQPIIFEDQELFYMQELGTEDFNTFMTMLFEKYTEEGQQENNSFNVINSVKLLSFLLRKMCIGVDFEDKSDEEIVETLNNMSSEITNQINNILDLFVVQKLTERLNAISKWAQNVGIQEESASQDVQEQKDDREQSNS